LIGEAKMSLEIREKAEGEMMRLKAKTGLPPADTACVRRDTGKDLAGMAGAARRRSTTTMFRAAII
jgi:hypothetical protein